MPWRIWPVVLVTLFAVAASVRGALPAPVSGDFAGPLDIGDGRKLYLECKGKGRPVVVLEAGLRNRADIWSVKPDAGEAVLPQAAAFTRVCAYDRPGTTLGTDRLSRSDPVPMPRTAADAVADLHALAGVAAIPPPYVLVGHSTGGLIARLYASTYPREVAGLVLVDAIAEGIKTAMTPDHWTVYNRLLLVDPRKSSPPTRISRPSTSMRASIKCGPLRSLHHCPPSRSSLFPRGAPSKCRLGFPAGCRQRWSGRGSQVRMSLLGCCRTRRTGLRPRAAITCRSKSRNW